jgi:hypothetical protein
VAHSSVAVIEFAAGDRFLGEGRFRGIEGLEPARPAKSRWQNRSTLADPASLILCKKRGNTSQHYVPLL